jgi:hypothetical protein
MPLRRILGDVHVLGSEQCTRRIQSKGYRVQEYGSCSQPLGDVSGALVVVVALAWDMSRRVFSPGMDSSIPLSDLIDRDIAQWSRIAQWNVARRVSAIHRRSSRRPVGTICHGQVHELCKSHRYHTATST